MEFWDIYDENKKPTGRTMKRNDWCLKDGEYHLTVLGVVARPDGGKYPAALHRQERNLMKLFCVR